MKTFAVFILCFLAFCTGLRNYSGTEMQKCLNCLCHARSGCYSRINCARYSISFDYWKKANSPLMEDDDDPKSRESYDKCVSDENCILNTIVQYADAIGHMDCNCDGQFDCKDRLAIHLFGEGCTNPKFSRTYANRFNSCRKDLGVSVMKDEEGYEGCEPEVFD